MYAGLAKPTKQKFGTIWLRSTAVHWIRNACVAGGSISCIWITVTIPGPIEVLHAKTATLDSGTWATVSKAWNAHCSI
jgi:hypothetical protein